jgi:TatA/E family protein of Tat protein translocase
MDGLTPTHLLIALIAAVLILGPKRLPEVGAALGKAVRGFQEAVSGVAENVNEERGPR